MAFGNHVYWSMQVASFHFKLWDVGLKTQKQMLMRDYIL